MDEPDEPEELDAKARHGKAEQKRRDVIRGLLHEISAFFLVTGNKKVSAGDVILFSKSITPKSGPTVYLPTRVLVLIYLKIGAVAFPGLIQPRVPGDGQL